MKQGTATQKGRPRDSEAHQAILKAAIKEVRRVGFRLLSIDAIAAEADVGKTTIYRRWPNKAALLMDAFFELIGPATEFPKGKSIRSRIQKQVTLQAQFFRSKNGQIIRELLSESQFNSELAEAFHNRWLLPRRLMTRTILEAGVKTGELCINDFEIATDMLYGPFYYRLMLKSGSIDDQFARDVLQAWMKSYAGKETF